MTRDELIKGLQINYEPNEQLLCSVRSLADFQRDAGITLTEEQINELDNLYYWLPDAEVGDFSNDSIKMALGEYTEDTPNAQPH